MPKRQAARRTELPRQQSKSKILLEHSHDDEPGDEDRDYGDHNPPPPRLRIKPQHSSD